ncbi:corrinoid protein [Desulfosporosinus burensis]|uniref:cobalamin B12-binding domain-containing protein n=1 Tax=Desulfosporosinus sp. BICA1-9 TaxID=1531958 RepID=UPI00054C3432|nr:cobalamin-dependent protein [Desulfosporosinus sp. BICA1-9]KJS47450.1 MAG: cobalamin-binding protein [Peptococcaceae bacterium BRH_c23]KJS89054.1 MAG: cobalamin-binding protein [Desulfosporosinus sp. BICA1-9]HBW36720.1 cobalamin-binding protein [Desulfosporosinus sp.]
MSQEILDRLKQGVIDYDEDAVSNAANEALAQNVNPHSAVFDGLVLGMVEVGRLYEEQEYFVPEMLMCADAMYVGLNILKPHMSKKEGASKGVVVMGVVQGDVHDIGKNIVRMMFDASGFEVHDLGRDVPLDKFVEEQLKTDSDMVCLSAMMTTTMVGMKEIIEKIKEKNPKCKIMIGGAPVTSDIASRWGADGYARDANNALKDAINMIASLKSIS